MNYNKKIIIVLGIFFSIILLVLSLIHIAFNFIYPGNELAESIKENFKDSFGKSIKFDSMTFKYNGDIILQNFYLSNTTDFNDNVNLIKCDEVIIDTYLLDLLRKKVTFSSLVMYNPDINVIKSYGKSYTDTFINDIISGFNNDKVNQFITKDFSIKLKNSKLYYREIFKNSKTSVDFYNVDLYVDYFENGLKYNLDGKLVNSNLNFWENCGFNAEGRISFSDSVSKNRIGFSNIDISIINNLVSESYMVPLSFKGDVSGELFIITGNDEVSLRGEIEGNKFFTTIETDGHSKNLLRNEDFRLKTDISASLSMDKINIRHLEIVDNVLKLTFKSDYIKDELFSVNLESDNIDLSELSYRFTPVQKCRYDGNFSFYGKLIYNLKDMTPDDIALEIKLNNFSLEPVDALTEANRIIKNCNGFITADKEKYNVKADIKAGESDLDISFSGQISDWAPFKSINTLDIKSGKIELALLKKGLLAGITKIYDMAYIDMFQNFDEQRNFLKEPEGIFLNNNNLTIEINADKVIILDNTAFDNLECKIKLEKGVIRTEQFSINGYDGIFNFNTYIVFRQEYPFIKIEGGVENLNISKIAADSESCISAGGILSSDFKFETNAFRLGQIVENGRAEFNLEVKDGYISGTESQNKLKNFISDNGYEFTLPEPLTFSSFAFTLKQASNHFFIKGFRMSGNRCNFSSYGKYEATDGLNVPVNLSLITDKKYTKVPLKLTGELLSPCLMINDRKKKKESICFN
ncbi:MAG TPA: hypothetical protein PK906_04990 [Spirochaetota bacterium]|nr:hypothetical protein [Spirochaetota bacterium]